MCFAAAKRRGGKGGRKGGDLLFKWGELVADTS